jgi:hypothetical protein
VATDQLEYFQQIERFSCAHPQFEPFVLGEVALPLTKFEGRFRKQGLPIYRLTLRKISKPDRTAATD